MDVIWQILSNFFLALLCVGGTAGTLLGLGLLLKPEKTASANQYYSRWFGAHKIEEQLDRPRWIERVVYRYHQPVGAAVLLGALFVLYAFLLSDEVGRITAYLTVGLRIFWDAFAAAMVIGSVIALPIGIIVFLRPSLLRELEKASNRWVSTEGAADALDTMNMSLDTRMLRHCKWTGAVLIIGGLYVLVVMGRILMLGGWTL